MKPPITAGEPPPPGLVAGKYQLVRLIGRGGMGSVWEARNVSIGSRFAIKFIEADYVDSAEARDRFIKEARAAATVDSKHLIRIFDHGHTEDGRPFLVMELLEGEPLDRRLERGPIPLEETARILNQVCRGVGRAHAAGIVHRDLKPENVFLVRTADDDHDIAKVVDFGIAKMQPSEHNPLVGSHTKTGSILGTPFYMSPEQARGLRSVDHRSDLWSIGVIAFRCVTGQLPFDGESIGDLLVKICTTPPPVPSHLVAGLPHAFDAWLARALERDPERRFQTCAELADALAAAAGLTTRSAGTPLSAVPVASGPYPGGAYGVGGPSPFGAQAARTPPPAGMTEAPFTSAVPGVPAPGRAKYFVIAAVGVAIGAAVGGAVLFANKRPPTPAAVSAPAPPAASGELPTPPTPLSAAVAPATEPTATGAATDTLLEPASKPAAAAGKSGAAPGKTTPRTGASTTRPEPAPSSPSPSGPRKAPPAQKSNDDPGY